MSSLLEEAIVDAKALKEAALKNAETAVLEKYSSDVKKALDTLLEQDELGLEEDTDADPELTEFIDEVPYAFQNEEIDAPAEDEILEIDFDALKTRIAEEEAAGMEPTIDELNTSEEVALDLAEGDNEDPTFKQMADDEDDAEKSTAVASSGGGSAGMPLDEDEDIGLTEEMLSDLIEELVVDMVPRPQGWSSEGSAYNSIEQANNEAMLAALEAHSEGEVDEDEETRTAPDVVSDDKLFERKYAQLTESTKELRVLLIESKNQLTQLNLENAKLVYQNKALSSTSLNERQKNQIVEAVQSAHSVEEANMIFETIQNAVGVSSSNSLRPQTLREAVQRPTSLLINSKRNNEATIDPNMGRMLRLAGLNK
jgi:hypothetical protein